MATGHQITIVSDASMNAANNSCFAWVIATTTSEWTGTGPVPGPAEDNHIGRAEAYGVLTALQFLHHYLTHYPTDYSQAKPIKVFCDNCGVIQRTQQLLAPNVRYPRDSIQDDYDLYATIAHIIVELNPIKVELAHIKGHQDKAKKATQNQNEQPQPPLTLEAQLNIQCDAAAAKALSTDYKHGRHTPVLPLPPAYPHLYIQQCIIVRKIQQNLRDAAVTPNYRQYLMEKYQWTNRDCDNVNWNVIPLTMQRFPANDRQRLQKFLHDWLPLNGSHHTSRSAITTLCPSCHKQDEDFWHFLECQHQPRPNLFRLLQKNLTALHVRHNIEPEMYQLLWQGLCSIRFNTPLPDPQDNYPQALEQLYHDQKAIGWDQLYYGQIAVTWAHHLNYTSNGSVNGTIFYSQVMNHIWRYILETWKQRNQNLHSKTQTEVDRSNLQQQVLNLIHTTKRYPQLEHLVMDNTEINIMKRSIPAIRQWIVHSTVTIKQHIAAERKQAVLKTPDIRNYFVKKTTQTKDRVKPP